MNNAELLLLYIPHLDVLLLFYAVSNCWLCDNFMVYYGHLALSPRSRNWCTLSLHLIASPCDAWYYYYYVASQYYVRRRGLLLPTEQRGLFVGLSH